MATYLKNVKGHAYTLKDGTAKDTWIELIRKHMEIQKDALKPYLKYQDEQQLEEKNNQLEDENKKLKEQLDEGKWKQKFAEVEVHNKELREENELLKAELNELLKAENYKLKAELNELKGGRGGGLNPLCCCCCPLCLHKAFFSARVQVTEKNSLVNSPS